MPASRQTPSVLIGTPTYDRLVHTEYLMSMLNLLSAGVTATFGIKLPSVSLLPFARNYLVTALLEDASYTHLLFVDADMGFAPGLVQKMLAFDQPFVGCAYARREIDYRRLAELARERPDLDEAKLWNTAMGYVGDLSGEVRGSFIRAVNVGTGLLLIKREVVERMREVYPELWVEQSTETLRNALGPHTGLFQPFTTMLNPNGIYSGEDVAFCRRWREGCGGEIWACIDETVTHSGRATFSGNFADRLEAQSKGGPTRPA